MGYFKAIPTQHNGYLFRSKLEARWAVFFEEMGIKYIYENEGYEIVLNEGQDSKETIRYLPDFYFPDIDMHGEVKGIDDFTQLPREDGEKMSWMVDFGGPCKNGIIFFGNLPYPDKGYFPYHLHLKVWKWSGESIYMDEITDCGLMEKSIDNIIFESAFDGLKESTSAPNYPSENKDIKLCYIEDFEASKEFIFANKNDTLYRALTKARQARFDHGEDG